MSTLIDSYVAVFETADGPNRCGTFRAESADDAMLMAAQAGATRIIRIARAAAIHEARIERAIETGDIDTLIDLGVARFARYDGPGSDELMVTL